MLDGNTAALKQSEREADKMDSIFEHWRQIARDDIEDIWMDGKSFDGKDLRDILDVDDLFPVLVRILLEQTPHGLISLRYDLIQVIEDAIRDYLDANEHITMAKAIELEDDRRRNGP